jgi:hypothetical protein
MSYKLFLDDYRTPNDTYKYTHKKMYLETDWIIVRSYDEFIKYIKNNGVPKIISFDHDLGDEHYELHLNGDDINYDNYTEKTGYDCAKWLINYILDEEKSPPQYIYIHSMNPAGSDNIKKIFENFYKHYYN